MGATLAGAVMEDISEEVVFEQRTESLKEQPCGDMKDKQVSWSLGQTGFQNTPFTSTEIK